MPLRERVSRVEFDWPHAAEQTPVALRECEAPDVSRVERTWLPLFAEHGRPEASWPWAEHITRGLEEDDRVCLAIESEGALQALVSLVDDQPSRLARGARILYVEYLGRAPWHELELGAKPLPRLGIFLIHLAAQLAFNLGLEGRVGLHAKSTVESYYTTKLHFTAVGRELEADGEWLYCELSPAMAARLQEYRSAK